VLHRDPDPKVFSVVHRDSDPKVFSMAGGA
jgi:hypothetical protein